MPNKAMKSTRQVQDPEVVGKDEHLELVRSMQVAVSDFFLGAGKFFQEARDLRLQATDVLTRAHALTLPTDDNGDQIVQRVVIDSNKIKKANKEHWEPITQTLHKLHRLMTSGRGTCEVGTDTAASIGNRFHSDYVAEKERKARVEQQRLDRLAREAAQREQDEITRRLEEERLKLEADSPNLSDREQSFVTRYDRHGDTIRAEREAGYKEGFGTKLLERDKIKTALELLHKKRELSRQQDAAKAAPVVPKSVAPVRPTFSHVIGGGTRKQRGADVFDEAALIEAILLQAANPPAEGEPVIPTDVLKIHAPKVNEYGRSLGREINAWPGVRYTEDSKVTGS